MSFMLYNGRILLAPSGRFATSAACCCDEGECCECDWLQAYWTSGGRLKITFTGGPISGYVILCPDATDIGGGYDPCVQWRTTGCPDAFTNMVDHCALLPTSFDFLCRVGDTSKTDYILVASMGSAGCAIEDVTQVQADCGPPFFVVYTAAVVEIATDGCECEGQTITMTVENLDPWP